MGGPGYESHRVFQQAWDTGHLFLFAGLAYLALRVQFVQKMSWYQSLAVIIAISILIGIFIEVTQSLVGRNTEVKDLLNDTLGAVIGYCFYFYQHFLNSPAHRRIMLITLAVLLVAGFSPLLRVIVDEFNMKDEFPVLSNFESSSQLTRWDLKLAKIKRSNLVVREGKYAMQVNFLPGKYPDITLQHFPRDWSGYKVLSFSVFNAQSYPLEVNLKIYDKDHILNGYAFEDRFNKELELKAGWNDFKFDLEEILNSPENRRMDVHNIKSLSIFLDHARMPVVLFLDGLMLQ